LKTLAYLYVFSLTRKFSETIGALLYSVYENIDCVYRFSIYYVYILEYIGICTLHSEV